MCARWIVKVWKTDQPTDWQTPGWKSPLARQKTSNDHISILIIGMKSVWSQAYWMKHSYMMMSLEMQRNLTGWPGFILSLSTKHLSVLVSMTFLVATLQTALSLGPSIRQLVGLAVTPCFYFVFVFLRNCSCPNVWLAFLINIHAHPHAISVAVFPILFSEYHWITSNGGCRHEEKSRKHWSIFTQLLSLVTANLFFH